MAVDAMSAALLTLVTVIYLGVAISYARDGRTGMAIAFVAYAAANVGFIIDAVKQ